MSPDLLVLVAAALASLAVFALGVAPILRAGLLRPDMELRQVDGRHPADNLLTQEWLAKHINMARHSIEISSDGLNPLVFTDGIATAIAKRLEEESGLTVRIITGPVHYIDQNGHGNPIVETANRLPKDVRPRMQISPLKNPPMRHFGIFDDRSYYLEVPHPPMAAQRTYVVQERGVYVAQRLSREFERMWATRSRTTCIKIKKYEPKETDVEQE